VGAETRRQFRCDAGLSASVALSPAADYSLTAWKAAGQPPHADDPAKVIGRISELGKKCRRTAVPE